MRRGSRRGARALLALATAAAAASCLSACSPIYVIRAGIEQAKILSARRPIPEVVTDSTTDERTRGMLMLALEAREFARDELLLDVGDSYTSFVRRDSDTLALVLSAAYRDRFAPRTWWFPIVGHVPYRGFFDADAARRERAELEAEGFDTLLRPTAAFSTLGWFADPLMSTLLRGDHVELVETVLHELSHNHLFVSGRVRFNESYATFVGRAGAVEFFCTRRGGGPDTVWCRRAQARWRDVQRWSAFIDELVVELQEVYGDPRFGLDEKLERRQEVWERQVARFEAEVEPTLESLRFGGLLDEPLNNARLLGQMRYYHRLGDFDALLRQRGSVANTVAYLAAGVGRVDDPFNLLPPTRCDPECRGSGAGDRRE